MSVQPAFFETQAIRRVYDEETETWWFSVVDIVQALTQQPDYQTARKYWNKLKERLGKEGSQLVTSCHQLKMLAAGGKRGKFPAARQAGRAQGNEEILNTAVPPAPTFIEQTRASASGHKRKSRNSISTRVVHTLHIGAVR